MREVRGGEGLRGVRGRAGDHPAQGSGVAGSPTRLNTPPQRIPDTHLLAALPATKDKRAAEFQLKDE